MLTPVASSQFKKDVVQLKKQGKNMGLLASITNALVAEERAPKSCNDHPLRGVWSGYRDLHVAPDWLLIYRVENQTLYLARTGSHSELFKK